VAYPHPPRTEGLWALGESDYLAAAQLATEHGSAVTLVLGLEASSLHVGALSSLVATVEGGADFAAPHYETAPNEGLVNSSILAPMTRALYAAPTHMPLAPDAGFSLKMARRIAMVAKRASGGGPELLLWPAAEAAAASLVVREARMGPRTLPQPTNGELNTLLAQVLGSFFGDLEAKAPFWQRARTPLAVEVRATTTSTPSEEEDVDDLQAMLDDFRNAYDNLQELWALVLPPQSRFRLMRLSRATPEEFFFPPDLWARTVYDFFMAFHLRAINRGHLLGAFTPLYLAWVASHIAASQGDGVRAEAHVFDTAAAFVAEKPYLVSRWRWPDRFNP
ncbi:MAG: hypothetical protein ABI142_12980, partial [Bryocella sp.]